MKPNLYPVHYLTASELAFAIKRRSNLHYRSSLGPLNTRQARILAKLNSMTGYDFKPVMKASINQEKPSRP